MAAKGPARVLLDTHTVLWWLADVELDEETVALIASPDREIFVSAATIWEAEIKAALGKLEMPENLIDTVLDQGFEPVAITFAHAGEAARLPPHHRDPFDRMLIAQARTEGLTIATRDAAFDDYDVMVLAI